MAPSEVENKISERLEKVGAATVVGKSGSGKTWIAKKCSVIATKNGLFDSVIWLFLNRKYDKGSVYKSIANQLSLFSKQYVFGDIGDNMDVMELNEEKDLEKVEKMITDALKGKKILLVLDDEGNKMKKGDIDGMLPSSLPKSSQVLITTVNEDGSYNVTDPKVIEVGTLSKEESMSLLRRGAGSKAFEFPEVKRLAEAFVERVMDQPAAIIVTAKALSYFCKSNSGVGIMESALKEVQALNDEQFNSIKLRIKSMKLLSNAHEMLPSRILMDCAWGGSHFFRDRGSFHYNELIAYWILEGYLGHIDSIVEAYKEGYRVLMDLIDCQLLKKEEDDYIIMEKSEEADYIVRMLGLDNRHRSGFDGTTKPWIGCF
ncbi:hypothetical protein Vadar_028717 [Vaccinium darrowii]|uniref:Uncharacterized protein n=1 Tax=Vaccinium darrowii TaxID=229202 RepID=A0ACB7Y3Z7_9ERIC|nr:hypothetical protein Vadar_028717 [Vaccinium darrowii]